MRTRDVAQLGDGADVALFENGGVDITSSAFVEINGSLKAGHAAEAECYADRSQ